MTPTAQQPQSEYIITEQLLKDYYEGRLYYNEFLEKCRTRPHTPAPIEEFTQEQARRDFVLLRELRSQVSKLQEDNTAIARAATLATLDKVGNWMEEYFDTGYDESGRDLQHIREFIESLRQSTTAQEPRP
jgi:hypothetical protein